MTEPLAIKWAWRHCSLDAETFDSEDAAIRSAGWASDQGQEAIDCIEVWDEAGYRLIPGGEVLDRADALNEAGRASASPGPRAVAAVVVTRPGGKEAVTFSWHTTEDGAEQDAARLRPMLGNRVAVKRLSQTPARGEETP